MTPRLRKIGLMAHITVSVGWLGAVAAFLLLSITGLTSKDTETVRSAYLTMNLIGRFVIVPLSLTALATGFVQALGTEWGLFRHRWVLAKLLLTLLSTIVLLAKIPLMGRAARLAAEVPSPSADLRTAGMQLLIHSAGGLLVLLVITTLSVFKPWGLVRNGHHELQTLRDGPQQPGVKTTGVGRKIFLTVIGVMLAIFLVLHLANGGLGHHNH
jgi:hypothetical protein